MQRTRSQWESLVPYRLDDVSEAVIRGDCHKTVIRDLRSFELISEYYDKHCLAVDVWFLFDRRPIFAHRRFTETGVIQDSYLRILFGVVVQAVYDAKVGRPCDSHSWRCDHPPGGERCSPMTHLCRPHAVKFIAETADVWESVLNLSGGTLLGLTANENGSVKSRSQEILNCTDQES